MCWEFFEVQSTHSYTTFFGTNGDYMPQNSVCYLGFSQHSSPGGIELLLQKPPLPFSIDNPLLGYIPVQRVVTLSPRVPEQGIN